MNTKTAIVSGAGDDLGFAIAMHLSSAGMSVALIDQDPTLKAKAQDIQRRTLMPVIGFNADISDAQIAADTVAAIIQEFGFLNVLINNPHRRRSTPVDASWEDALADWATIINNNLRGTLFLSRACIPHLKEANPSSILNISSADVLPFSGEPTNAPDQDIYLASKWALNGFTDGWAEQLKAYDIRVNALCPGRMNKEEGLSVEQVAELAEEVLFSQRNGENVGITTTPTPRLAPSPPRHLRITGQAQ